MEENYKFKLKDFRPWKGYIHYSKRTQGDYPEEEMKKVMNRSIFLASYNSVLWIALFGSAALGLEKILK